MGGEKVKKGHVDERAVTVGDLDSSSRAAEGRVLQETEGTLKCCCFFPLGINHLLQNEHLP